MSHHITCAQCRHENPATERFCGQCGASLAADVPAPSADVVPKRSRSGRLAPIAIACLAIAIVAAGATAVVLMQRGGSGGNDAASTAQFATCGEADAAQFGPFRTSDSGAGDLDSSVGRLGSWYRQLAVGASIIECSVSIYDSQAAAVSALEAATQEIESNSFSTTLIGSPMKRIDVARIADESRAYEATATSGTARHVVFIVFRKGSAVVTVRLREHDAALQATAAAAIARAISGRLDSTGTAFVGSSAPTASGIETPEAASVVAIAINAAGDEALPAAVFDADGNSDGLVTVPAGLWYLVTFDSASGARRSPDTIATDGKDALRLDQATERVPGTLDDQRSAFTGLLDYFVTYQTAYLVSLDTFTNGYTKQLFDPSIRIDADHAQLLHLALDNVDAAAAAALDGVSALGSQSSVAAPGAGPSYGLYDYLKNKIQDPIKARERAKKARQDVALAFGRMTIQQQREAFRALGEEEGMDLNAADAATFVEKLDRGDFDNDAAQIRKRLQDNSDFFGFFDLRNIETAHQEGAALVTEGANFYGKAIKQVLDKVFPGIAKGWDYVEKLEKNLQKADKLIARGSAIADYLRQHGQQVTDAQAAALAAAIDAGARNMAGQTDAPSAFDAARIGVPIGRIDVADGERRRLMIALQYDNPKGATLSLRCKYVGPASADASTRSVSDAAGIATFTFDAGYAPKNGTYAIDCSLDDYITRTATFSYGAAAAAEPSATPTVAPDEAAPAATPMPQRTVCSTVVPHSGPYDLDDLTDCIPPAPSAEPPPAPPPPPPAPPPPATPTPCTPSSGGYDPIGGLSGGRSC